MVSIIEFTSLERDDTGDYTCTATNSLPDEQTGSLMDESLPIPLIVLGE